MKILKVVDPATHVEPSPPPPPDLVCAGPLVNVLLCKNVFTIEFTVLTMFCTGQGRKVQLHRDVTTTAHLPNFASSQTETPCYTMALTSASHSPQLAARRPWRLLRVSGITLHLSLCFA